MSQVYLRNHDGIWRQAFFVIDTAPECEDLSFDTNAGAAARYRARKRGENVPKLKRGADVLRKKPPASTIADSKPKVRITR